MADPWRNCDESQRPVRGRHCFSELSEVQHGRNTIQPQQAREDLIHVFIDQGNTEEAKNRVERALTVTRFPVAASQSGRREMGDFSLTSGD